MPSALTDKSILPRGKTVFFSAKHAVHGVRRQVVPRASLVFIVKISNACFVVVGKDPFVVKIGEMAEVL